MEIRPLRSYAEINLGRQRSPEHERGPHMIPYLRAANVKDGVLDLSDVKLMNFSPAEQARFALRPGDVLVTEGSGSLMSVGASAVWSGELQGTVCFQNTLLRLRPRAGTDGRFLAWWCRYAFADGLFASVAGGANIFHLSADRLRSLSVSYAPLPQQRAIADFLDAETARIDALIEKKRRLVDLTCQRFEAEVFRTTTLGLRTDKTRQTGLGWVTKIPAWWATPPVSANFDVQLGKMLNAEAAAGPAQFPYLRNVNVQWDRIDLADLATMHFDEFERRRYALRKGDVLVCEGGEVGRTAVWNGELSECYFQKAIHRVRPRQGANGRYLMYALRAAAKLGVFAVEGNQSTIVHLTGEQLRVRRLPWPPLDEQDEIVEHLDRRSEQVERVTRILAHQTQLLQERRQALITGAVTGELEVPGVAA